MSHFDRDRWNAEAVFMAVQPWELDVIERGLACLAALASTHPEWITSRVRKSPPWR